MRPVAITGVGLCCALGEDLDAVVARLSEGGALAPQPGLAALPDPRAAVVPGPDLRPWLKRRKDAKLLARPAQLALVAGSQALGAAAVDRTTLGLYLAVGREPPDQGDSEPCLIASERDGAVDDARLAGPGRDLYPPLLPLSTLPNMALAHLSINLAVLGENGAWAGEAEAGFVALEAAWWAVAEGRVPAALCCGADSLVDLGSARDRLRLGYTDPPGEAGAALLLQDARQATAPLALLERLPPVEAAAALGAGRAGLRARLGDTGAAEGPLLLALALGSHRAAGRSGAALPWLGAAFAGAEPPLSALGFRVRWATAP